MADKGLIFDLEDILISYTYDKSEESSLIFDFLRERKYIFHEDDLKGVSPQVFAENFTAWRGSDYEILLNEIGKFQRRALLSGKGDLEAPGVLQVLSAKYSIAVIARSRGDGIVKALSNAGIRGFINYIVPGESWLNEPKDGIALDLVMAKFPNIAPDKWYYVGRSEHEKWAKDRNIVFLCYGASNLSTLEDVMEELM